MKSFQSEVLPESCYLTNGSRDQVMVGTQGETESHLQTTTDLMKSQTCSPEELL